MFEHNDALDGQELDVPLDGAENAGSDSDDDDEEGEDGDPAMEESTGGWDEQRFRLLSRSLALVRRLVERILVVCLCCDRSCVTRDKNMLMWVCVYTARMLPRGRTMLT